MSRSPGRYIFHCLWKDPPLRREVEYDASVAREEFIGDQNQVQTVTWLGSPKPSAPLLFNRTKRRAILPAQ